MRREGCALGGTGAVATADRYGIDGPYAWSRLGIAILLATIGSVGMWSVVVALPAVQADFGAARGEASLPYTMTMLGFAFGGVLMGRLADRMGIQIAVLVGSISLGLGYVLAGLSGSLWQYALAHAIFIGAFGSSATFGPMIAHVSFWFARRRGIAVALCACGNYLAGTIWPPVVQRLIETVGWRQAHIGIGLFCTTAMLLLVPLLRRRPPHQPAAAPGTTVAATPGALGLSPGALQTALWLAGLSCCVAMAMPQVHIVAYCSDLGYGAARGAEMLSLMLGFGIVSRIASGFIADRIGGLPTILLGSFLQGVALLLYLFFDGLTPLYVISAAFGLFQGGIVPSYALVVREYFPPAEAGARVGAVLMATLFGMALGGWVTGAIFDWTGSYHAAFANGLAWNLLNLSIVAWLLTRRGGRLVAKPA
jgi:MFS family permease